MASDNKVYIDYDNGTVEARSFIESDMFYIDEYANIHAPLFLSNSGSGDSELCFEDYGILANQFISRLDRTKPGTYDESGSLLHTWNQLMDLWGKNIAGGDMGQGYIPPSGAMPTVYAASDVFPADVVIPADVTNIGSYVLWYYNYTEGHIIRIPNTVTFTFLGKPTSIASNAFGGGIKNTVFNVPWSEGEVANAPWGLSGARINYNYKEVV